MKLDFTKLLELYSDLGDKELNIILNSISYSFNYDQENTINIINILCDIKSNYHNFKIKYNQNIESSYFDYSNNIIYLNTTKTDLFIHELTHAIHYYKEKRSTPKKFQDLFQNLVNDENFISRCIDIIDYISICKKNIYEDIFFNKPKLTEPELPLKMALYDAIDDIIDAFTKGELYDKGLSFWKNNDSYIKKASKCPGHGPDYYKHEGNIFAEVIAQYSTIRNTEYRIELFKLLRLCLGDDMLNFLEEYYLNLTQGLFKKIINSEEINKLK